MPVLNVRKFGFSSSVNFPSRHSGFLSATEVLCKHAGSLQYVLCYTIFLLCAVEPTSVPLSTLLPAVLVPSVFLILLILAVIIVVVLCIKKRHSNVVQGLLKKLVYIESES